MGLEFLDIFRQWANDYDNTVHDHSGEYQEVFADYPQILQQVTSACGERVLEFGSGTGNLTIALLAANKVVYPVEPSEEMYQIAKRKEALQDIEFIRGDMDNFSLPDAEIDTIVSSFVFHHLTEVEKQRVLHKYASLLPSGGRVVFADTMFLSQQKKQQKINQSYQRQWYTLAEDLTREHYPLLADVESYFDAAGFSSRFRQLNEYVWLVTAEKIG